MGLPVTRKCVESAIEILETLSKKKCTVEEAHSILSYVSYKLNATATVPETDYREMFKDELQLILEEEEAEK